MEFFDVIEKRTSINKYKDIKIPKESIEKMIEAAMRAPSWKNRSAFRIIVVDDVKKKEELSESIKNKDDKASNAIKEAPIAIIIVAKPEESGEVEGKDFYLVDGAIAMEHIILAATAEGYGTLWIGALDEDNVKEIFNIPNEYKVIGITPIGEIAEEKAHNKEKDKKDYAFKNEFNNPY